MGGEAKNKFGAPIPPKLHTRHGEIPLMSDANWVNVDDAVSSNSRKYNTFPRLKLQTISDDDESDDPSDYEKMDEAAAHQDITPVSSRTDHTTGDVQ